MRVAPPTMRWVSGALILLGAGAAAAQNAVTLVSVSGYGNFHAAAASPPSAAMPISTPPPFWSGGRRGGRSRPRSPSPALTRPTSQAASSPFPQEPRTKRASPSPTPPEPTLRTLYVSLAGNDGTPGTSPGLPLRTIQHAADLAFAGDLVLIAPGVYRERVSVPDRGRRRLGGGGGRPLRASPRVRHRSCGD